MSRDPKFREGVAQIFEEFFETGQGDGKVHTLQLETAPSKSDETTLKALLADLDGVTGVHVDSDSAEIHILCTGATAPLANAVRDAGYKLTSAH